MKRFFVFLFFISSGAFAQDLRYNFTYDTAGNQTQMTRTLVFPISDGPLTPLGRQASEETVVLQKFYPDDHFSYYPNPVKEQLFLKWEPLEGDSIVNLKIFSITGLLLRVVDRLENLNEYTLSFSEYPTGTYLVSIGYKQGEEKTITIIKS